MEEVELGLGGGVGLEVDGAGAGEKVEGGGIGQVHAHSAGQVGGLSGDPVNKS